MWFQLQWLESAGPMNVASTGLPSKQMVIQKKLERKGLDYRFNRVGSMFCLFFTGEEIVNLDSVMTADTAAFRKFFTSMLEQRVYMAPSPYETGFISVSHGNTEIDQTLAAMDVSLSNL